MAYRHKRNTITEPYEEHFSEMDSREVNFRRVVNIVEKRPRPGLHYDRDFHDDQWYNGPRNYQGGREYYSETSYQPEECFYFDDNFNCDNFQSNPSTSQNRFARDDLRYQLDSRNNGRPGPYFRPRGQGSRPSRRKGVDKKAKTLEMAKSSKAHQQAQHKSGTVKSVPDHQPTDPPGCSPKGFVDKPVVLASSSPVSSVEGSPHNSGSSEEKTASVAETPEVPAASMEPKPTPEDEAKTGRLKAIKEKALEIEKDYRQDCETFRTVVKMLVAKEPSLDNLLQAPLDENLLEMKQRCLDALRNFVKELDNTLEQPDTSATTTGHKTQVQC